MKLCPKCKAELDDSARFCLRCMTPLDEKEQIQPPLRKKRRWPFVLAVCLVLCVASVAVIIAINSDNEQNDDKPSRTDTTIKTANASPSTTTTKSDTAEETTLAPNAPDVDTSTKTCTVDGVTYTFRRATRNEHPTAIILENNFTLIRIEGTSPDGVYQVPSFVGDDINCIVFAVADGAFDGTDARVIDLGYNVKYVWGDAFKGCKLTDLYLHEDVLIEESTLSDCSENLIIHCPVYIENTQGLLWSELAGDYGFEWQEEPI